MGGAALPNFNYRARDPSGSPFEGVMSGDNEKHVAEKLRAQGLIVVDIEINKDIALALNKSRSRHRGRITLRDLAVFCRQFATMIGAGVAILQSLRIIARQAGRRRMGTVLQEVCKDLEAGETLTNAFARRGEEFPPILINMVAAGEVGGILEDVFNRLAEQFEKEDLVQQKVRSALIYPAMVSIVAVGVVIFMVTFVLPNFISIFAQSGAVLPLPTRILLGLSNVLRSFWYVFAVIPLLGYLWFEGYRKTEAGRRALDRFLLGLPIFGPLFLKRALALFARTLGTLLKSGVPIMLALSVAERSVGNKAMGMTVREAQTAVRDGRSMIGPLQASPYFPQMVVEMMAVGEETGAMDAMLFKVADFYEKEVSALVERMTALIEPVVILTLGLTVGFIMVSMVLPMFDTWNLIR